MEKFIIICESMTVSRGTIKERKNFIYESFSKLSDAKYALGQLYRMFKKEMNTQLDERIKFLNLKDEKYLGVTIDNGFEGMASRMYYICKRIV